MSVFSKALAPLAKSVMRALPEWRSRIGYDRALRGRTATGAKGGRTSQRAEDAEFEDIVDEMSKLGTSSDPLVKNPIRRVGRDAPNVENIDVEIIDNVKDIIRRGSTSAGEGGRIRLSREASDELGKLFGVDYDPRLEQMYLRRLSKLFPDATPSQKKAILEDVKFNYKFKPTAPWKKPSELAKEREEVADALRSSNYRKAIKLAVGGGAGAVAAGTGLHLINSYLGEGPTGEAVVPPDEEEEGSSRSRVSRRGPGGTGLSRRNYEMDPSYITTPMQVGSQDGGDDEMTEEDVANAPSWLRNALAGLGAFTGYKRGGLTGGLMGGAGGYGLGELLQRNPGAYDWIKKNPQMAAMGGILGLNALGLDKSWGGGSSDVPEYEGYTPLTYDNLGGFAPSTEVPQMQRGGITDSKLAPGIGDENYLDLLNSLNPRLDNPTWKEGTTDEEARLLEQLIQAVREPIPFGNEGPLHPDQYDAIKAQNARHRALFEKYQREQYKGQPPLGGIQAAPQYMQRPTMAHGGISGGEGGLGGLRTGLRDAIVNSIDDPNRQGVNSFVPSMLKAYDEIPKLQAGGITKDQYKQGGVGQTPGGTQQFQMTPPTNQYNDPNYDKTHTNRNVQYLNDPNLGSTGNMMQNTSSSGVPGVPGQFQGAAMTGGGAGSGATGAMPGQGTQTTGGGGGGGGGVPGIGTGYDPMTDAIGQNILERRAGMGGLGSNMTDISLTRGMAPHMAGMQNQWYNQQMGMQQFNQRERENRARFGMQRAALENQSGVNPYMSSMVRSYA